MLQINMHDESSNDLTVDNKIFRIFVRNLKGENIELFLESTNTIRSIKE